MIEYVHVQLSAWGRRTRRESDRALGYPKHCPMFNMSRFDGAYGSRLPAGIEVSSDDHVQDTDAAVKRLSTDQVAVVMAYYVHQTTASELARNMGIARQRFYERLHSIHQSVLGHLNDVVAGC